MPETRTLPRSAATQRPPLAIQHIRSPLQRAGYGLTAGQAQLLLLHAGEAQLRARKTDEEVAIDGRRLLWLADGGGRELLLSAGSRGVLLTLPQASVSAALPATALGDQMRRTLRQSLALALEPDERLSGLIADLETERDSRAPGEELASGHLVSLLLLRLWRLARADLIAHGGAPQGLAERFVLLAAQHGRAHWRVADYAEALGVNPDRLGSAVRRATGLSPKAYLLRALFAEACELLANTGMPAGQIAFRLGFADQGYFTRLFTRHIGTSPGRYRRMMKERPRDEKPSFAAWP